MVHNKARIYYHPETKLSLVYVMAQAGRLQCHEKGGVMRLNFKYRSRPVLNAKKQQLEQLASSLPPAA